MWRMLTEAPTPLALMERADEWGGDTDVKMRREQHILWLVSVEQVDIISNPQVSGYNA